MGFTLSVDVGTTFTAAALAVPSRSPQSVPLGMARDVSPTVVFRRDDDVLLVGEAADRRGLEQPDRVARQFKRRVGDSVPIILGGSPYSAQALYAAVLAWAAERGCELGGGDPSAVAVTHPASWGPYKLDLIRDAALGVGLADIVLVPEPEAAAAYYASKQHLPDGAIVAVYDLGGGTFDATVLRFEGDDLRLLGASEGIEHLGGIDFDEALLRHVDRQLGGVLADLDPSDPAAVAMIEDLRRECVAGKEALSVDTVTTIRTRLIGTAGSVRVTRDEFSEMIGPPIQATIGALRRAIDGAGITPEDLHGVLLVGGSSRIPAVASTVSAAVGRPTAVDAHPKHAIVWGALYRVPPAEASPSWSVSPEAGQPLAAPSHPVVPAPEEAAEAAAPEPSAREPRIESPRIESPPPESPPAPEPAPVEPRPDRSAVERDERPGAAATPLLGLLGAAAGVAGGLRASAAQTGEYLCGRSLRDTLLENGSDDAFWFGGTGYVVLMMAGFLLCLVAVALASSRRAGLAATAVLGSSLVAWQGGIFLTRVHCSDVPGPPAAVQAMALGALATVLAGAGLWLGRSTSAVTGAGGATPLAVAGGTIAVAALSLVLAASIDGGSDRPIAAGAVLSVLPAAAVATTVMTEGRRDRLLVLGAAAALGLGGLALALYWIEPFPPHTS